MDTIFTADPENFLFQGVIDAAVGFEILHQFIGFIDEKVELLTAFTAAHI